MANKSKKQNKKSKSFKSITSANELKSYLESTLRDKEYIYHYTTIDKLYKILRSGYFIFSSMQNTNDLNESNRVKIHRKNYYVGSFSRETDEVIAMWGMYSIPWELGIRIGIPTKIFRSWINNTNNVYPVDNAYAISLNRLEVSDEQKSVHAVCYVNEKNTKFSWSNVELYIKNNLELLEWRNNEILSGFIKEKAWMYESEVRAIIKIDNFVSPYAVALPITDELVKSFEITLSPKFDISKYEPFLKTLNNIKDSKYKGMVVPKVICHSCVHKYSLKELLV